MVTGGPIHIRGHAPTRASIDSPEVRNRLWLFRIAIDDIVRVPLGVTWDEIGREMSTVWRERSVRVL